MFSPTELLMSFCEFSIADLLYHNPTNIPKRHSFAPQMRETATLLDVILLFSSIPLTEHMRILGLASFFSIGHANNLKQSNRSYFRPDILTDLDLHAPSCYIGTESRLTSRGHLQNAC